MSTSDASCYFKELIEPYRTEGTLMLLEASEAKPNKIEKFSQDWVNTFI
jgi:hypothetical protein